MTTANPTPVAQPRPVTPTDPTPAHGARVAPRRPRWEAADWLAVVALAILSVTLVGLHVLKYRELSPLGELQQVDYAYKASRFDFARPGDPIDRASLVEASCHGIDVDGYRDLACTRDDGNEDRGDEDVASDLVDSNSPDAASATIPATTTPTSSLAGTPATSNPATSSSAIGSPSASSAPTVAQGSAAATSPTTGDQAGEGQAEGAEAEDAGVVGGPLALDATESVEYPVYHTITGMIARVLVAAQVFDSFVVAARMVGALWMWLALAILWYAFAVLSVARVRRAAILAVFVATPLVVFHAATVSSDAALLFLGALITLTTIKIAAREWSAFWVLPVALLAYATAPAVTIVIVAMMLFLLFDAFRSRRGFGQWFFPIVVAVGVVALRWRLGDELSRRIWPPVASSAPTAAPAPSNPGFDPAVLDVPPEAVTGVASLRGQPWPTFVDYAADVSNMFTPIAHAYLPEFLRTGAVQLAVNLANWMTIALGGIMALMGRSRARLTVLARLLLLACLVAGPLTFWYFWYFNETMILFPARRGLGLVAALIVIAGGAIQNRFTTIITALVGLFGVGTLAYYLIA